MKALNEYVYKGLWNSVFFVVVIQFKTYR